MTNYADTEFPAFTVRFDSPIRRPFVTEVAVSATIDGKGVGFVVVIPEVKVSRVRLEKRIEDLQQLAEYFLRFAKNSDFALHDDYAELLEVDYATLSYCAGVLGLTGWPQ